MYLCIQFVVTAEAAIFGHRAQSEVFCEIVDTVFGSLELGKMLGKHVIVLIGKWVIFGRWVLCMELEHETFLKVNIFINIIIERLAYSLIALICKYFYVETAGRHHCFWALILRIKIVLRLNTLYTIQYFFIFSSCWRLHAAWINEFLDCKLPESAPSCILVGGQLTNKPTVWLLLLKLPSLKLSLYLLISIQFCTPLLSNRHLYLLFASQFCTFLLLNRSLYAAISSWLHTFLLLNKSLNFLILSWSCYFLLFNKSSYSLISS